MGGRRQGLQLGGPLCDGQTTRTAKVTVSTALVRSGALPAEVRGAKDAEPSGPPPGGCAGGQRFPFGGGVQGGEGGLWGGPAGDPELLEVPKVVVAHLTRPYPDGAPRRPRCLSRGAGPEVWSPAAGPP